MTLSVRVSLHAHTPKTEPIKNKNCSDKTLWPKNETLGPTKYFEVILSSQTKLYYWHTKHMRCNVTQNWNQIEMKNSLLPTRFEGIFFQPTT